MNTNLQTKTIPRLSSLGLQDSLLIVDRNVNGLASALINHKEVCGEKTNNSIKQSGSSCPLPNSKDIAPRSEVSVDFAAKQLFQILLVHVKYIHSKSVSDIEPLSVPFESNPLIINI